MTVNDWGDVLMSSLQDIWRGVINFLPNLIGAILILIIGWYIAILVEKLVVRILKIVWIDNALKKLGIKDGFEKAGIKLNIAKGGGFLVKWFLFIVFIVSASEVLNLQQVTEFLDGVVSYLPNVIVAVIILLLGVVFANFAQSIVRKSVEAAGLLSANFLASVAKWAILIFSILAALVQLKVAANLLETLFTGLVAMLALAGGLAFGLGGREKAKDVLEKIHRDVTDRKDNQQM
ncbi:MAG: hypothetical protein PHH01_00525 [Patescibacteria group bacterium]|nr:hypothetical protein [Patescibacteria group bacterium]MDD5566665.1 hypothetical protein [Patescibacteria group bacterium]